MITSEKEAPDLSAEYDTFGRGETDKFENPAGIKNEDILAVVNYKDLYEAWEYSDYRWLCTLKDGRMAYIRVYETGTCSVCGNWHGTVEVSDNPNSFNEHFKDV